MAAYRLVLIHVPGAAMTEIEALVDALEMRIRVPASHHRTKPGIRLPVVLDWRGRVLVFAKADWAGERRLREALPAVLGDDIVAIDSGSGRGLRGARRRPDPGRVQRDRGREPGRGVAGSATRPSWRWRRRSCSTTQLVRAAIEQELGPLLADARMGEELIETLEVYLGSEQNIREAARRLHLAPRTVAYRLERIETLLGEELDGEVAMRLSAAILALRVSRQADQVQTARPLD